MVPRNRNAAQSAVEGIEDYIRRHNLHVGDLLPSEMELCDELGCSRSSLREAMRTLVSLDIVEVRQGQGTFVSKMSLAPLIRGMVLRVTLDVDQSFEHLLQVVDTRQALEVSLADELAQVHDEDSIHELHELVNAMYRRVEQGESFAEEDRRFHATLLRQTRNQLIESCLMPFGRSTPRLSRCSISLWQKTRNALSNRTGRWWKRFERRAPRRSRMRCVSTTPRCAMRCRSKRQHGSLGT